MSTAFALFRKVVFKSLGEKLLQSAHTGCATATLCPVFVRCPQRSAAGRVWSVSCYSARAPPAPEFHGIRRNNSRPNDGCEMIGNTTRVDNMDAASGGQERRPGSRRNGRSGVPRLKSLENSSPGRLHAVEDCCVRRSVDLRVSEFVSTKT